VRATPSIPKNHQPTRGTGRAPAQALGNAVVAQGRLLGVRLKATPQATRAATPQAAFRSRRRPGFRDHRCDCGLCVLPTSICHTEFGARVRRSIAIRVSRCGSTRPSRSTPALSPLRWLHNASPANRAGRLCVLRPRRLRERPCAGCRSAFLETAPAEAGGCLGAVGMAVAGRRCPRWDRTRAGDAARWMRQVDPPRPGTQPARSPRPSRVAS